VTWFRVDDSFPSHPKTRSIPRGSRRAVIGTWTTMGAYAARHLTNGLLSADNVIDEGGTKADALALVKSGLWHPPGVSCGHPPDECPGAPADGHYQFHDWLVYQPSRAEILAEREKKITAGRAGGLASARSRRSKPGSKNEAPASAGPKHVLHNPFERNANENEAPGVQPPSRPDPNQTQNPLLALVCRRLSGDARATTDVEIQLWEEAAGNADLETELKAWLIHNAGTDLRDPGAALLGWLRTAARRAGHRIPECSVCIGGWLADEFGQPSERRCPTCRPHLRSVAAS